MRGTTRVDMIDGIVPEYAEAARRYFGEDQGRAWAKQVSGMVSRMARITVRPEWAGVLDFETRFPSARSP